MHDTNACMPCNLKKDITRIAQKYAYCDLWADLLDFVFVHDEERSEFPTGEEFCSRALILNGQLGVPRLRFWHTVAGGEFDLL